MIAKNNYRPPGRSRPLVACVLDGASGAPNACAYIRLILPLTQPALLRHFDVKFVTSAELYAYKPNVVIAQRLAFNSADEIDALVRQCKRSAARLIYEIDDDLLSIGTDHSEYGHYKAAKESIRLIASLADQIWTSTPNLGETLSTINQNTVVLKNNLDQRVWEPKAAPTFGGDVVRILYMGTVSHSDDFTSLFLPAFKRLKNEFGDKVTGTVIGVVPEMRDTDVLRSLQVPGGIGARYPAFARWLQDTNAFDLGVAPLTDTPFNCAKSHIKWLEYGGLGLPTVASAVGEYRQSISHKSSGWLAPVGQAAFHEQLREAVLDDKLRQEISLNAQAAARESVAKAAFHEPRIERLAHITGVEVDAGVR